MMTNCKKHINLKASAVLFIILSQLFLMQNAFANLVENSPQKFSFYSENQISDRYGFITDSQLRFDLSKELFLFQLVGHQRQQETLKTENLLVYQKSESWLSFRAEYPMQKWLTWRSELSSNLLSYHGFYLNQEWQQQHSVQDYFFNLYGEYFVFPHYKNASTNHLQFKFGPTWQGSENQIAKLFFGYLTQSSQDTNLGFKNTENRLGAQWSIRPIANIWIHSFLIHQFTSDIENKNQFSLIIEGRF